MRVTKTKNPAEVAAYFRRVAQRSEDEIEAALAEVMDEAVALAKDLSSGEVSQKELDLMGNPYATRHRRNKASGRFQKSPLPIPYGQAAIINAQSGEFRAGWESEGPEEIGGEITGKVKNDTEYAHFLTEGTTKMIRRPLLDRIEAFVRNRLKERVREAIIKAFDAA